MANQLHTSLLHTWQGIDDPGRLDSATINLEPGRLSAHGAPGIKDPSLLIGALDCDLGLCPLTNTMPILRLNLHSEELAPADETSMVMAWVEVPSLRVMRSSQMYSQLRSANNERNGVVLYSSDNHGFTAELQIDREGVVIEYPGLATRIR